MPPSPEDHPGTHISRELDKRGWTQMDLAFILDTSSSTVSHIVTGRKAISASDSKALGEAFGMAEDHFLSIQKQHDLDAAEGPSVVVQKRALVQQKYPLREMIKRGWIEEDGPRSPPLEERVASFFGVETIDQVPHINHAARKTDYKDEIDPTQLAWLHRVVQLAREMAVGNYSPRKLRDAVAQLAQLRPHPNALHYVPSILGEAGVRFVIVEGLPGGKIDGVCLWLTGSAPVIGLSLRFDRIDNFWFVLRHEIEHVLNKDGQHRPIIDAELEMGTEGDQIAEEERKANAAAADFCVDTDEMDSFYRRKAPLFSRRDVQAFAKRVQTHPGLVVGQLQYKLDKWSLLRDQQVKVRQHLETTALTDGWGNVIPVYH